MDSVDGIANGGGRSNDTLILNGELGPNMYDNMFPALPASSGLTNEAANQQVANGGNDNMRVNITEITQAFCIPADELKQDNSDKFGEGESVRICAQIMKETNAHIEISTSKDKSSTFLITGKPNNVAEAKRRVINSFQTLVSTSINIPKDHHRSVLGKSGERLKQLEKATGTKITIPSIKDQSESIYVTGTRDGIEKALHEIKIISDERSKKEFIRMSVPKMYHPFISGANGENIANLMTKTNTRINIPPAHVNKEEITIVGDKTSVEMARNAINAIYDEAHSKYQVISFTLDKAKHKHIIGQRRSNLFDILEKTGVSVEVPPPDDESELVVLRGPMHQVSEALKTIMECANGIKCIKLDVDNRYHRFVIGKKGCYIRELQENHKQVHIEFCEDEIKVDGPIESVDSVREKILSTVKYYSENFDFAELKVDPRHFKHIIGKNGVNVNRLKSEYEVNIIISENNQDLIRVEGLKANVAKAMSELKKIIAKLENEVEIQMKIEPVYHRTIIGAKGERVRSIQEKFRAIINFPSQNQTENVDVVRIRGSKEDADNCRRHLSTVLKDIAENHYTLQVPIYKQFHKCIIGKGGANIKKIKDETSTKIELPAEGDVDDVITIIGKRKNVEDARDRLQKIQDEMETIINKDVTIAMKYHSTLMSNGVVTEIKRNCGNVVIKFPPSSSNSDKVSIRGPQDDVMKAKQQLLNALVQIDLNSFVVNIKANPDHYKYLIGRGGSNVKRIVEKYDVRVMFPDGGAVDKNVVTIKGKKDNVQRAKTELTKMVEDINNLVEEEIDVDSTYYKFFLTARKELLLKIIDESGGSERVNIIFPRLGQNKRVIIKGFKDSVKTAKELFIKELNILESGVIVYVALDKDDMKMLARNRFDLDNVASECQVRIAFDRPFFGNDGQEEIPLNPDRNISEQVAIVGTAENCEKAKMAVLEIIPTTTEIEIPRKYHASLIGRNGSVIHEIIRGTDVLIDIPQPHENSDMVKVKGKTKSIKNVIERLNGRVEKIKSEQHTVTLTVEPIHRSCIIGRKGDRINKIRKSYNVTINLPGKDDHVSKDVSIVGTKENVEAAANEITNIISDVTSKSRMEVQIDPKVHGKMTGAQGRFVKQLMDEYNVVIKFPRLNEPNQDPSTVVVIGEMEKIEECIEYMHFIEMEFLKEIEQAKQKEEEAATARGTVNNKEFVVKGAPWEGKIPDTNNKLDFPAINNGGTHNGDDLPDINDSSKPFSSKTYNGLPGDKAQPPAAENVNGRNGGSKRVFNKIR